jgi:hypothetical protein
MRCVFVDYYISAFVWRRRQTGDVFYIPVELSMECLCFTVLRGMDLVCIMLMRRLRVYKCLATTVMKGRMLSRVVIASIMQSVMCLDMIVIRR